MSKTLDDALKAVQDICGRVTGVRSAPEYATDKVPPGIWCMAFPVDGEYSQPSNKVLKGLHNIGLYVYAPRVDLPKTLRQIVPYGELITAALESETSLLDTVSTFGPIRYTFNMALNVGTPSAPAYATGWSFVITDVKIENTSVIT